MIKNIKRLIQRLSDEDQAVRREAAERLSAGDERAVYPLIKALSDENAGVQDTAMRSLIDIGGETTGYMILPLLRKDVYLRNTALVILRELGEAVVSLLYSALKDKDNDIRKFAIDILRDIKEGVDPSKIVPLLSDPNANVRAAAAKAIGAKGYKNAIPELSNRLKDDEWVCFYALEALGELRAEEVIEEIEGLLHSRSTIVRFAAIEALGKIGSKRAADMLMSYLHIAPDDEVNVIIKGIISAGVTPEMSDLSKYLIKMLEEGDLEEREIALKGIASINCREAIPIMVDIAGSLEPSLAENEQEFLLLRDTIVSINSEEELLKILDSPDIKHRGKSLAIEILGEMRSEKAIYRLVDYLADSRRGPREASAVALGKIGRHESIRPLIEVAMNDADSNVRRSAIEAIGNMQAKDAFSPLLEMLELEEYYDIIEKIVESLMKIDATSFLSDISQYRDNVREAIAKTIFSVELLLRLTNDPSEAVKIAAIHGLGYAGTDEAISRLVGLIKESAPDIRKAAIAGLGEARYCAHELFDALKDEDSWVRFYAVKAIALSCDNEEVIKGMKAAMYDEFIPVVMSVIDILMEIGSREAYEILAAHKEHRNLDVREKIKRYYKDQDAQTGIKEWA